MIDEWEAVDEPGVAVAVERETLVPGALRAARQEKRMSTRQMGLQLARSAAWVSNVEAGKGQITPAEVAVWATLTGWPLDGLYGVHRETT